MKIKINMRSLATNIIECIFVALLVLNCNTIWTRYENSSLNKILKVLMLIIVTSYVFIQKNISRKDVHMILLAFGLCALYIIVYTVVVGYNVSGFLFLVVDVLCIYIFARLATSSKRTRTILYRYEAVIIIIAVISLVFWLFGSILGILHPTGYVYSTWGSNTVKSVPTYFNLYFETQSTGSFVRNTAIFTEAPMCSFQLCIALLIELFCKKNSQKIKCIILITAVLTTVSMTGWCMLVIALFAKYAFSERKEDRWRIIQWIVLLVAFIVGIIVVSNLVFDKIESRSGSTRLDDFVAGFKAWKTNPFFGIGYGNDDYVKQFMSLFRRDNQGFSNSPMQILYQGGVMLAIPYLYFTYKWIKTCIRKRNMQWLLLFICFIYLFVITIVSYNFLTEFIFMIYGTCQEVRCTETQKINKTG